MAYVDKRKKEEENLKALRELTALEHNKKCLECHRRGITYVDMMTYGFVCVQCSGYLLVHRDRRLQLIEIGLGGYCML